jgi:SET domain-containing protein
VNMEKSFYVSSSKEVPGEQGCFLTSSCKKGAVLEFIPLERALPHLLHIDEFMDFCDHDLSRFCYRYSGDLVYFSANTRLDTDYINHSQNPNVLIYMGLTIALRDINAEEEILADYRFLMHERFTMLCGDYSVKGFSAQQADKEFILVAAELARNAG